MKNTYTREQDEALIYERLDGHKSKIDHSIYKVVNIRKKHLNNKTIETICRVKDISKDDVIIRGYKVKIEKKGICADTFTGIAIFVNEQVDFM